MSIRESLKNTVFVLDIGNSKAKLSVFSNGEWQFKESFNRQDYAHISDWIQSRLNLQDDILFWSSVVASVSENLKRISSFEIKRTHIPKEKLNYDTPETLGMDRFLACLGAWSIAKSNSVIVIDAGTALTIDLMDENGVFQGGIIAPGLRLWEESLNHFAPALPKVEREIPTIFPPKSTKTALQWGISGGFIALIKNFIIQWKMNYPNASVFCTGGDGKWIAQQISDSKFDTFLVEKGIYEVGYQTYSTNF